MKIKLLLSRKRKFIAFLIFFAVANLQAQYTLIPDANFEKQLIQKKLDDVMDGKVLTANINTIEQFVVNYTKVEDITGIEDFTALKDLTVYFTGLKKIDLSHNNALESINIGNNNLISLDLSQNIALKKVNIQDYTLSTLDLSNNPNLEDVFLGGPLANLNMANGHNEKITRFSSQNAHLLSCIKVDNLDFATQPIWLTREFDNPVFSTTDCGVYTPIADAVFEQSLIDQGIDTNTTLDRKVLTAAIIDLETLDLNNGVVNDLIGISDFKALQVLNINKSSFYSIDLSHNANLKELRISNNSDLEIFDISQNENLEIVHISNTGLKKLDISKNPKIIELFCNDNRLTALNLKNRTNDLTFSTTSLFTGNSNLSCIEVDNVAFATSNWLNKDATASYYNAGCPTISIPDPNFEQALINLELDDVIDGKVITGNIAGIEYLYVNYSYINDLTGIEGFTSLTNLQATGNNLKTLDLSNNTLLEILYANNNQLNNLNLSKNLALSGLNFNNNNIKEIDVANNTALQYLFFENNKITKIDISKNNNLTQLSAKNNPLVNVSIKGNTNNISYLDLTGIPNLSCIEVDDLDFANNGSHYQWYKDSSASYSQTACDVYTYVPDAAFEQLLIDNNIDSGVIDGKVLTHEINTIPSLSIDGSTIADFTGLQDFTALTSLDLVNNVNLTQLDISKNTQLTHVYCRNNKLTNIDVSKNPELIFLLLNNNELVSLDVTKNTKLVALHCVGNQLTSLDVSKNIILTTLDLGNNSLSKLDVSSNPLTHLNCYSNQLVTLDLSANTQLTNINCQNNQLKSVNLKNGNNTNLQTFIPAKSVKNKLVTYPIGNFGFQANDPELVILVDNKVYSDDNWMSYKDASAVYLENISLGTGENNFETVAITPNPTQGELYINNITLEKITVFSLLGNVVRTVQFNSESSNNIVDLSDLTAGLYLVKLSSNGLEKTVKVLKK